MNWIKRLFKINRYFLVTLRSEDGIHQQLLMNDSGGFPSFKYMSSEFKGKTIIVINIVELSKSDYKDYLDEN